MNKREYENLKRCITKNERIKNCDEFCINKFSCIEARIRIAVEKIKRDSIEKGE